jgi:hypothetical protein
METSLLPVATHTGAGGLGDLIDLPALTRIESRTGVAVKLSRHCRERLLLSVTFRTHTESGWFSAQRRCQ